MMLPASETKHVRSLAYTLPNGRVVNLLQDDSLSDSTGRSLWLSAQVLVLYLHSLLAKDKAITRIKDGSWKRKKVIELGAGTGLVSLYLHSESYDILSTDIPLIAHSSLLANFDHNPVPPPLVRNLDTPPPARLHARGLDWNVPSSEWDFTAPRGNIASSPSDDCSLIPTQTPTDDAEEPLGPPFDLVVLSDVLYFSALIPPLLDTLTSLSDLSPRSVTYMALERRDPDMIDSFFLKARERGWKCSKIEDERLRKLMRAQGWEVEDWEDVEVWSMKRRRGKIGKNRGDEGTKESVDVANQSVER